MKKIKTCQPLREYSWLINRMRAYKKTYGLEKAATMAIIEMPDNFEIKGFLKKNMAEVVDMMTADEYELHALDLIARANEKKGRIAGKIEGKIEGKLEGSTTKLIELIVKKIQKGKQPPAIADELEENVDEVQRIFDIAVKHAPDYDPEEIYQELNG